MADARHGLSGVVAGRYRVERLIGEGGMATVYLGHDLRHDSRIALKVLRPELAAHMGGERFVREIRITAQLQHPNILPVFDSGEADGRAFYVMPFVEGETLAQRLQREGPLPINDALAIAAEVADALAYAHERGFVHRDVKPSNIMLTHGHALLADFGIARAMDAAMGDALTETGLSMGTVTYMSPEQALGEAVDGRTDIYSLGCVLYEILAGTPPFTGSRQAVLARHSVDPVPSLRSVRDSVPEDVEQVIVRAMAKAPADRFPDAGELKAVLRRHATATTTALHPEAPPKRTIRVGLLAGVGVIAVAALAAWLLVPGRSSSVLAPDRVMVLPLRVSEGYPGPPSTGEDVATLIINALDGAGDLRWIDGLARLDPEARDHFGVPSVDEAGRMARASGAAHFVTGSITPAGADRVSVSLTLYETASGEPVRTAAPDPTQTAEAWQAGLVAANQLLSELIDGAPDVSEEWRDREPGAIASFLRGEAAFRRVRLEEALGHYRDALARDSSFALAAIRGAQAAAWGHREGEAATMVRQAIALPLPPRYADFVRGYAAYLRGDADQATAALRQTITLAPEMSEAWMQLGETYTHLLPRAGEPDSLALAAFEAARRLDPTASDALLHMIEIRLRHGETAEAEPLLTQFLSADPDSAFAAKLDIMHRCTRDGPDAVDWDELVTTEPFPLMTASKSLSVAAAQPACAMAGYRALLATDTAATDVAADGRRWASLIGLQSLLISTGRPMEAAGEVDAFVDRWGYGGTLLVLDGLVVDTLVPRARAAADEMRQRDGPYDSWRSPYRLWVVGALEATRGDVAEATAIADELARRAASGSANEAGVMEQSLRAHIALARGDSADALGRLRELVPPILPGDALSWDEFAPMGLERLALARLLLARGEYLEAIRVADVFDSQAPHIFVLFTGESLRLRREAATYLRDRLLLSRYDARLEALGN
jgi:tRNA A-37 threonylcarbamoyl transferase component Bud32/tetratricopeptide (TPR) repeat protein